MKKILFVLGVVCGALLLTSCGHNGLMFTTGQYGNLGYDPSTNRMGVVYINGQQVSMLNRQNTSLEIEMKDAVDAEGKTIQSIHKIKYTVGKQINGYTVQLEELKKK